jgi:CBS-domain-containing membrane protein
MTRDVVTCRPEDDVETAARLMGENQIRRIAVTDEGHHLAGIVSLADISWNRELNVEETAGVVEQISSPSPAPSKPRQKQE